MADLTCDRCADVLGDYLEGRLAPDVVGALEAHVASCAGCAALVRDYEIIPAFLRGATDVRMPLEVEVRLRRLLAVAWRKKPV
jgi:anti-sigma factor RsiW